MLDGTPAVRIQGDEVKVRARIRFLDLYSGHADGPELSRWVRERLPVRGFVFLALGEEASASGLRSRLSEFLPSDRLVSPQLDDAFELAEAHARKVTSVTPRRIEPARIGKRDWHNDVSELLLDINAAMEGVADERARDIILRRLRRALDEAQT